MRKNLIFNCIITNNMIKWLQIQKMHIFEIFSHILRCYYANAVQF